MEYVKCDLCGADDYEVIWDKVEREKVGILRSKVIRDKDGNILNGCNVMCKQCGLIYVNPRMTKQELEEFYEKDYRKVYGGTGSLVAEKRHAENARKIIEEIRPLKRKGKFLDIGCSTGRLLNLIGAEIDVELYGVEPNTKYCKLAKEQRYWTQLKIFNTTIENFCPSFKFDTITMLNTLEHLISPTEALNKVNNLLNNGGYFLCSVPNLLNSVIRLPVDAFLSNAHLYNFTVDTLKHLFWKCGFKVIKTYGAVEEMGEKIYMLGQKGEDIPGTLRKSDPELLIKHLETADKVFDMKMQIYSWGFS